MKKTFYAFVGFLLLTGCNDFGPTLEKSERDFADKNYINVIDALNAGLPHWKESDGPEKKAEAYQLLGKSYHKLRNTDKAIAWRG